MSQLIGTGQNQVPVNGLLGTMAFQDRKAVNVGSIIASADATINGVNVGLGGGAFYPNTAVGTNALAANTTGGNNTAFGYKAGFTISTGASCTLVGANAGTLNTASSVDAFGYNAGAANTSGQNNVFIGSVSGSANTTGAFNCFTGPSSGRSNTTGSSNTFLGGLDDTGTAVGRNNTTGYYNTAVGSGALKTNTTSYSSTAVGFKAGSLATGVYNQFFGSLSGSAVTTGAYNVILGGYDGSAAPISATGSNFVVLSDGAGNVRQTIDASGNVGIGTASPSQLLDVRGNSGSDISAIIKNDGAGRAVVKLDAGGSSQSGVYFLQGGTEKWRVVATGSTSFQLYDVTAAAYRLSVDNAGNLGIGTASPGAKLDVQGTSIDGRVYSTNSGGKARMFVRGDTANMSYESDGTAQTSILFDNVAGQVAYAYYLGASGYWRFYTNGTEKVRIDNAGRFMVGLTAPYVTASGTSQGSFEYSQNGRTQLVISNQTNGASSSAALVLGAYGIDWFIGNGSTANNSGALTFTRGAAATAMTLNSAANLTVAGTISPQQATTAAAPAYVKGAMYFDTTLNKLRIGGATAWETVTSV